MAHLNKEEIEARDDDQQEEEEEEEPEVVRRRDLSVEKRPCVIGECPCVIGWLFGGGTCRSKSARGLIGECSCLMLVFNRQVPSQPRSRARATACGGRRV